MIRQLPARASGDIHIALPPGSTVTVPAGMRVAMDGGPHAGRTFYVMHDLVIDEGTELAAYVEELHGARLAYWRVRWWFGRTLLGRIARRLAS